MEDSLFVLTIAWFILLILLPLRLEANNFNTGLVQFYNTSFQISSMNASLSYTYRVYP